VRTHIVQKGDTLWKIAKQYGIDFEELKRLNSHLANPDYIVPGMEIILPDDLAVPKQKATPKELPDKAKAIETPPKEMKVETPPKEKPIEKMEPKEAKKEEKKEELKMPPIPPIPSIPPIPPTPVQQLHSQEKNEFHFDIHPQFSIQRQMMQPQIMPIPQPVMPQPIFIEIPQPAPQAVKEEKKEEKEKVVEKEVEYVPVPQTHVEYVPVPQPIYIPCMPQPVHPCHGMQQKVEDCGCRGRHHHTHDHVQPYFAGPQMLPPCPDYQAMPYPMMPQGYDVSQMMPYPGQEYAQQPQWGMYDGYGYVPPQLDALHGEAQEDTDWLFDSTSKEDAEGVKTISQGYGQLKDQQDTSKEFEQATTLPAYDYYQYPQYSPMEQGYYSPMYPYYPQPTYPQMEQYQQQYQPMGMNPCAPQFKPWSY